MQKEENLIQWAKSHCACSISRVGFTYETELAWNTRNTFHMTENRSQWWSYNSQFLSILIYIFLDLHRNLQGLSYQSVSREFLWQLCLWYVFHWWTGNILMLCTAGLCRVMYQCWNMHRVEECYSLPWVLWLINIYSGFKLQKYAHSPLPFSHVISFNVMFWV